MRNSLSKLHFNHDDPQAFIGGHARFKGDGGGAPSSNIRHTKTSRRISSELFPAIQQGIAGNMFGGHQNMYADQLNRAYDSSFDQAFSDYKSDMNRIVAPEDRRVRAFMTQQLSRDYNTGKDVINRQLDRERISDKDMSTQMAADAVAMDQRMAVSGAQMYNQALQTNMLNERQFGTFGTNVAGGIGSGLMDMYFAKQMSG